MTVQDIVVDDNELNHAERAFLDAVLICHGILRQPSESDFKQAMRVMIAYAQQVEDNPPEGAPSVIVKRWLSQLSGEDRIKVAAAAFVKFGVTKPNIFQVRAAHRAVLGQDSSTDSSLTGP